MICLCLTAYCRRSAGSGHSGCSHGSAGCRPRQGLQFAGSAVAGRRARTRWPGHQRPAGLLGGQPVPAGRAGRWPAQRAGAAAGPAPAAGLRQRTVRRRLVAGRRRQLRLAAVRRRVRQRRVLLGGGRGDARLRQ